MASNTKVVKTSSSSSSKKTGSIKKVISSSLQSALQKEKKSGNNENGVPATPTAHKQSLSKKRIIKKTGNNNNEIKTTNSSVQIESVETPQKTKLVKQQHQRTSSNPPPVSSINKNNNEQKTHGRGSATLGNSAHSNVSSLKRAVKKSKTPPSTRGAHLRPSSISSSRQRSSSLDATGSRHKDSQSQTKLKQKRMNFHQIKTPGQNDLADKPDSKKEKNQNTFHEVKMQSEHQPRKTQAPQQLAVSTSHSLSTTLYVVPSASTPTETPRSQRKKLSIKQFKKQQHSLELQAEGNLPNRTPRGQKKKLNRKTLPDASQTRGILSTTDMHAPVQTPKRKKKPNVFQAGDTAKMVSADAEELFKSPKTQQQESFSLKALTQSPRRASVNAKDKTPGTFGTDIPSSKALKSAGLAKSVHTPKTKITTDSSNRLVAVTNHDITVTNPRLSPKRLSMDSHIFKKLGFADSGGQESSENSTPRPGNVTLKSPRRNTLDKKVVRNLGVGQKGTAKQETQRNSMNVTSPKRVPINKHNSSAKDRSKALEQMGQSMSSLLSQSFHEKSPSKNSDDRKDSTLLTSSFAGDITTGSRLASRLSNQKSWNDPMQMSLMDHQRRKRGDTTVPTEDLMQMSLVEHHQMGGNHRASGPKELPLIAAKDAKPNRRSTLTFFGNPILPIDVIGKSQKKSKLNLMHHKDALQVLDMIKQMKRIELKVKVDSSANAVLRRGTDASPSHEQSNSQPVRQQELKCLTLLKTAGSASYATLSMTGCKGGTLGDQVNHDRSLIVSPFFLRNHDHSPIRRQLMAVFDGHAERGHAFAEHCVQFLPSALSRKLSEAFKKAVDDLAAGIKSGEDETDITKRVLTDTFLAMNDSAPKEESGGCTATVIYQQGQKVYIANTGDSRSFIVIYRRNHYQPQKEANSIWQMGSSDEKDDSTSNRSATLLKTEDTTSKPVKVVYISREDKPDVPEERKRLEAWGGEILPAERNKSAKVKFSSNRAGKASATLSMSRSIGDNQFTSMGVIPDPVVDVVDITDLVRYELKASISRKSDQGSVEDDVCIFAICASDGMMIESIDNAEALAAELAPSLFRDNAPHPLTACQEVIAGAAAVWEKRNKGKFRDDITVAVTILRVPGRGGPPTSFKTKTGPNSVANRGKSAPGRTTTR